ncbi:MAG: hypothetical protein FJZ58_01825 [Chlamydiae bacterium]|nr:hypothetical protein [Chlamydiota bacterium]
MLHWLLALGSLLVSLSAEEASISDPFALSVEEILLASKLSDQNRYRFCHCFSSEERERILSLVSESGQVPNDVVNEFFRQKFDTK